MNGIKNGFTLIELLAVIILIGIVAVIAIPKVNDILEESRTEINESSTLSIVRTADAYFSKNINNDDVNYQFNGTTNILVKLNLSGKKPDSGYVVITDEGKVSAGLVFNKKCYLKTPENSDVTISGNESDCVR